MFLDDLERGFGAVSLLYALCQSCFPPNLETNGLMWFRVEMDWEELVSRLWLDRDIHYESRLKRCCTWSAGCGAQSVP